MTRGEARAVRDHVEGLRRRVAAAAGPATLVVGTLADTVEHLGTLLVTSFREAHPHVTASIHEADLADPSAGLRAGLVDVALTRTPFDTSGLALRTLRTEAVGVVLRADDPLAVRDDLASTELAGRHWVRLPDGTDERWRDHWCVPEALHDLNTPPVRTIQECLQAVLWNGATALAPLGQQLPTSLVTVPVVDRAPSELVVAWDRGRTDPLIRLFFDTVAAAYGTPVNDGRVDSLTRGL